VGYDKFYKPFFMRIARYLCYAAILLFTVSFSLMNHSKISISIPFTGLSYTSYFFIFIFCAFIIGIFTGYFLASKKIFDNWRAKKLVENESKQLKSKIDLYETELKIYDNIRQNNKQLRLSNISQFLLPKK